VTEVISQLNILSSDDIRHGEQTHLLQFWKRMSRGRDGFNVSYRVKFSATTERSMRNVYVAARSVAVPTGNDLEYGLSRRNEAYTPVAEDGSRAVEQNILAVLHTPAS
jgi:hypothetical protein